MVVAAQFYMPYPSAHHFPEPMLVDGGESDTDDSTSSTVLKSSFRECLQDDSHQQSRGAINNKRRVRFAPYVSYEQRHEELSTSPIPLHDESSWYSSEDYQFFRQSTLSQAQHVIDSESRNRAPHSYQRVLHRVYARHCCCSDNPMPVHESIHLQRWMTAAPSRLGLEKWCIRVIAHDKSRRRKATVATVKAAQSTGGNTRLASEQWSQASVLLAQAIAQGVAGSLEREDGHKR